MILLGLMLGCPHQPFILTNSRSEADYAGVDLEHIAVWEDGMRTHGGEGTVEWWYFDAHLDDGSTVVTNFLTKPIMQRGEPLTPKLEITITEPDGTIHKSFRMFDVEDFSSSTERCDVRIGDSVFWGDLEVYSLHAETEEMEANLVLTRVVESWRPGAGLVYFGQARTEYLGWLVAVPHGTVRGTVTINGTTRDVQGHGYHDHNWMNADITKPINHWYWGRAHLGDYTTLFFLAEGKGRWSGEEMKLFMMAEGAEVVIDSGEDLVLETRSFEGEPEYPTELDLLSPPVAILLRDPETLEREWLLDGVHFNWLLGLFVDPWYLRFKASTAIQSGDDTIEGESIYELMIFGRHP